MIRFKQDSGKADHNKTVIEVRGVSFSYGHDRVLEKVDWQLHPGDYVALIGPNGGGKTTLVKLILGLLKPEEGSIRLFGQDPKEFKAWHKVGYVAQRAKDFDRNFPITVRQAVAMGRRKKDGSPEEDDKKVDAALLYVSMQECADKLIGELSGGQQQRVFIARALVNDPEVLFMDEPMAGVDEKTQEAIYQLLERLNKDRGITLVVVSHDIERITQEVMHIACVDRTLTFHETSEDFLSEGEASEVRGEKIKFIMHHHHNHE